MQRVSEDVFQASHEQWREEALVTMVCMWDPINDTPWLASWALPLLRGASAESCVWQAWLDRIGIDLDVEFVVAERYGSAPPVE